jgi:gliding motility-associated-like protein
MERVFLLVWIYLIFNHGYSKHLVGGDMTYRYLGNFNGLDRYEITITLLRDCIPGNTEFDSPLEATLYNAGNFSDMKTITFTYPGESLVPLTSYNPCVTPPDDICYSVVRYVKSIDVVPNVDGYYLVYERCCRNNTINNLNNPGAMGMVLSCYIPSSQLRNSSPVFGALPPVYICLGDTFRFPQAAVDPDGDSLVYQLSTPYHGGSQQDPDPSPDAAPPFLFVSFAPGYNINNLLGNSPQPLVINQNGELYAICITPGQFVFAVSVFEYRNNVLISETKRDVQVNVVNCPPNLPPFVELPLSSNIKGDTLIFRDAIQSCIQFQIKDPNSRDSVIANFQSVITNNPYSNATINFQPQLTPASVEICWKPTCEQVDSIFPIVINMRDNYACGNNQASFTLYAKVLPTELPAPQVSCVSVINNNQISVSFPYNFDDKQDRVYIYRQKSGDITWQLVDSLNVPANSYTDNSLNDAHVQSYCYKIAVRRNCKNVFSFVESNAVCSMLIFTQNIDFTTQEISWTSLNNNSGSVVYHLEFEQNGNITTVNNVTSPYRYKNCSFQGRARVKAITGNCVAYSAFSDVFSLNNLPPSLLELCFVSVADENAGVEIQWTKSIDPNLKAYEIWRHDGSSWAKITEVDTNTFYYLDRTAAVQSQSYKYYVRAVDECNLSVQTNEYATIFLKSFSEPYFVDLQWTPYLNDYPVLEYELLKNQSSRNDFEKYLSFSPAELSYVDKQIDKSKGIYCYRIKANAPGNCGSYSYSNSVCETFPIILFVPNAFTPNSDGKNDIFKVYAEFVEYFHMLIYDRWGKLTYEFKHPEDSWDGTTNGAPCPEDVYVYFLEARGFLGEKIQRKGTIMLLR